MDCGGPLSADSLFDGKLVLYQPRNGYRFSLDAILLAGLTKVRPGEKVIDLGTGCGVIPLILAHRGLQCPVVGIELQEELARLARKNVLENDLSQWVIIEEMDYREVPGRFPCGSFDLVIGNPPYRRLHSGRMNANVQKARARHEITASVDDLFAAGKYLLPPGGRLAVIYPSVRLGHLLVTAETHGFAAKELTVVYSRAGSAARLVHLECRKGGGEELMVSPPFYIYGAEGAYTPAMQRLYDA